MYKKKRQQWLYTVQYKETPPTARSHTSTDKYILRNVFSLPVLDLLFCLLKLRFFRNPKYTQVFKKLNFLWTRRLADAKS